MTPVATRVKSLPTGLTADEFLAWVHRPENADRFFELERGEVIELPPPKKYHGFVCANVSAILWNFARQRQKGYPCSNHSGVIVEEDPDTVRGPDLTFYEDDKTAATMERAYASRPPVLAVEILSPDDRMNRTMRKVNELLKRGVALVWVVDPGVREVGVYRLGRDPCIVTEQQELTGEDVLPDFRCPVAEFFRVPGGQITTPA